MDIEQIKQQVIQTATERDRRDLCAAALGFSELLTRHGNDPRIYKARDHVMRALELALAVVR
jgi:hypothetical protein